MKARITSGELNGVEFELSDETIKSILDNKIPIEIRVGQVYRIVDSLYMVATFDDSRDYGLTCVDAWAGCYSSNCVGTRSREGLRKLLTEKNAKYIGMFNNIFVQKENYNESF